MNLDEFRNPVKAFRPMVRWWWPGLDVEKDELLREVDDLDRSGIGGAEIQPFMIGSPMDLDKTDPERSARCHRFMQPYHYEMLKAVVDEAGARGMFIDITENSAWPTGGTHISLEDSHKTLIFGHTVVRGERSYRGRVPKPIRPRIYRFLAVVVPRVLGGLRLMEYFPEDKKLVKVVAGRLKGKKGRFTSWRSKKSTLLDLESMVDITDRVDRDGRLNWEVPAGRWQIFSAYEGTAGAFALMDARSEPGKRALVVDHFNREALTRHLEAFLGTGRDYFGEQYGKAFRAIFTDSFELISPMHWPAQFLEEFKERRGYDISPYLPAMYVPLKDVGYYSYGSEVGLPNFDFEGDTGKRMRYDFQRTLSELFIEEMIVPAAEWAAKNGLKSRVQGYGMMADPLCMLGYSDVPETEQLYGGGMLNFLKLAGAAGTLYEKPLVTSETLVWIGRPYMTTPLKWRVGIDRLFEAGINQVIYHGFPYRHPAYPYPGYQPFASHATKNMVFSTDMSRDNPLLFDNARQMNDYAARAQYLLQRGKTCTSVGIFYQLFDFPNGNYKTEELVRGVLDEKDAQMPTAGGIASLVVSDKTDVEGDRKWIRDSALLGDDLVANGFYYLYFNEDRLLTSRVEDGRLIMGEAAFECLILYREPALPIAVAEKLDEITRQGVPVLFVGTVPAKQPGYLDSDRQDRRVEDLMASVASDSSLCSDHKAVIDHLAELEIQPEVSYPQPQPDLGFIHKIDRDNGEEYYFFRNRKDEDKVTKIAVRAGERVPVQIDLWSGEVSRMDDYSRQGEFTELPLVLGPYESTLIGLLDPKAAKGLAPAATPIPDEALTTVAEITGFAFSAERRWPTGRTEPVARTMDKLEDWRSILGLEDVSSKGTYRTTFSLPAEALTEGKRIFLVFERVCDAVEINVNGEQLPPLIVSPWRCEITSCAKDGENELEMIVTPTLRNQLVAYGTMKLKKYAEYRKKPTMASGLIGTLKVKTL